MLVELEDGDLAATTASSCGHGDGTVVEELGQQSRRSSRKDGRAAGGGTGATTQRANCRDYSWSR